MESPRPFLLLTPPSSPLKGAYTLLGSPTMVTLLCDDTEEDCSKKGDAPMTPLHWDAGQKCNEVSGRPR